MKMQVQLVFNDGSGDYIFPHVQYENGSDLAEGKDTIIEGVRASGCIVISGGKRSKRIVIRGIISASNYKEVTTLMNTMKTNVTREAATLTLKHYDAGWINDWQYTVKRISKIVFEVAADLRTTRQPYEVEFIVLSY